MATNELFFTVCTLDTIPLTTERITCFVWGFEQKGHVLLQHYISKGCTPKPTARAVGTPRADTVYYKITGEGKVWFIQYQNYTFRDYASLLGKKTNPEVDTEALVYIFEHFTGQYGATPFSPATLCLKSIGCLRLREKGTEDATFLNAVHLATRPGSVLLGETGAFVNELHFDLHQAYANALITKFYPSFNEKPHHTTEPLPLLSNLALIRVRGYIKLKPTGYPLIMGSSAKPKKNERSVICNRFDQDYYIDEWFTSPGYEVLAANYDFIDANIVEGYYWKSKVSRLGETFFNNMYPLRSHSNPAIRRFAKLACEYPAGLFQQLCTKSEKIWLTPEGDQTKLTASKPLNSMIGAFMTDYQRKLLSDTLQLMPRDHVLGWDTDAIHLVGVKEEHLPSSLKKLMGPNMGQWHIDAAYMESFHFAAKQYYGIDFDGVFDAHLAGISNGEEVAAKHYVGVPLEKITVEKMMWNRQLKSFAIYNYSAAECVAC